jgi:hypothetical protein
MNPVFLLGVRHRINPNSNVHDLFDMYYPNEGSPSPPAKNQIQTWHTAKPANSANLDDVLHAITILCRAQGGNGTTDTAIFSPWQRLVVQFPED